MGNAGIGSGSDRIRDTSSSGAFWTNEGADDMEDRPSSSSSVKSVDILDFAFGIPTCNEDDPPLFRTS